MSLGLIGRKLGMTQIFNEYGNVIPVTVVEAGPCAVTALKTPEKDGYAAVQLGFGEVKERKVPKPQMGDFKKWKMAPKRVRREFRVNADDLAGYDMGTDVRADLFKAGDIVDVAGTSKGHGFTGVIKRYHFHGAPGAHGAHEYFRHPGSAGASATPAHTLKGTKRPGQHGNSRVTVKNLMVVDVDTARNIILIRGAIPGPPNTLIEIKASKKSKKTPKTT